MDSQEVGALYFWDTSPMGVGRGEGMKSHPKARLIVGWSDGIAVACPFQDKTSERGAGNMAWMSGRAPSARISHLRSRVCAGLPTSWKVPFGVRSCHAGMVHGIVEA